MTRSIINIDGLESLQDIKMVWLWREILNQYQLNDQPPPISSNWKQTIWIALEIPSRGLRQAHKCGVVKQVNRFTVPFLIIGSSMTMHI
jgi:hypothetical protein